MTTILFFDKNTEDSTLKPINSSPQLQAIYQLIQADEFDNALSKIDALLQTESVDLNKEQTAWLYQMKALVHERRYHFHFAIKALSNAQKLHPSEKLQTKLISIKQHVEGLQAERERFNTYSSGEGRGLAKTLKNHVTIVYIYINDPTNHAWTGKRRLVNQGSIDKVLSWYQREAVRYQNSPPSFNVRYFVINSPRGIEKNWLRKHGTFDYLTNLFLRQSSYRNFEYFIRAMQVGDPSRQVAMVFHSNYQGRSYALRCRHSQPDSSCPAEYAMITEDLSRKKFAWVLPQIQAHEMLHLFGAADLYNIKGAKDYAVTDIMNYYSSDLKYASIDPITAWAIGWQDKPQTPFAVE